MEQDIDREETAGVYASSRKDAKDGKADPVDLLVDRSMESASGHVVGWVDQIYDWLEGHRTDGMSLEEVANRLPGLYGQLDSDGFVQSLETGMQFGDLIGRGEVLTEIEED